MEEKELIERLKKGDIAAKEYLIREYQNLIFNAIFQVSRDKVIAEDALQETFLRAFKYIKGFKSNANITTWLYRIAMNTLKDEFKKRSNMGVTNDSEVKDVPLEYSFDEKKKIIWEGMNRLSEEEREIITLVDIRGFSYEETSKMLDVPVGTVRSRLARSRDHLRDEILKMNFFDKI
ncbi:MAG: RNA polymerase sigma factor [Caldanaerobacter sp.]